MQFTDAMGQDVRCCTFRCSSLFSGESFVKSFATWIEDFSWFLKCKAFPFNLVAPFFFDFLSFPLIFKYICGSWLRRGRRTLKFDKYASGNVQEMENGYTSSMCSKYYDSSTISCGFREAYLVNWKIQFNNRRPPSSNPNRPTLLVSWYLYYVICYEGIYVMKGR